jgi:FixJ family two-component response regulator
MSTVGESYVYVVDNDDAFRSSAASILGSAPLMVAEFSSAQAFLRDFAPSAPVCALVDLELPDMDGLSIQARLNDMASWLPVIYTTTARDLRAVTAVMRAGAWHVLEKPVAPPVLLQTVCEALQMAVQFHGFAMARSEIGSRMASLSKREREILELLIEGNSSREIASKLGTSPFTVEKQRANMMHKLEAKTLPQLAMKYYISDQASMSVRHPGFYWWSYMQTTSLSMSTNVVPPKALPML